MDQLLKFQADERGARGAEFAHRADDATSQRNPNAVLSASAIQFPDRVQRAIFPTTPASVNMIASKPDNFPFEMSQVTIPGEQGGRTSTVLTPKNAMVFGRTQLDKVQAARGLSPVEQWLVAYAAGHSEQCRIMILRAVNSEQERVWLFDPSFDNDTLQVAGYVMTQALLPFHRALMAAGVMLLAHTDWGDRESYGIRHGVWRCIEELSTKTELSLEQEQNLAVLKTMVHHMSLSLDHVVTHLLPGHLHMVDRRWARMQEDSAGK